MSQSNCKANDAHKIEALERQVKEKDVLIEQLLDQINEMKSSFHAWVDRADQPMTENTADNMSVSRSAQPTHVAKIPMNQDESYFMTYAHFDIHYDMLSVSLNL